MILALTYRRDINTVPLNAPGPECLWVSHITFSPLQTLSYIFICVCGFNHYLLHCSGSAAAMGVKSLPLDPQETPPLPS